ncbi:MAG: DUF4292 domain-containing protein [Sandaracinaceae bacterium]
MTRACLFALFGVALTACAGTPCPSQPFGDPIAALDAYRDMRLPARVLRAEARVDRRDPDGRIRGTVLMFIERPERVRFDAMTQFGPAAVLTSDGEQFSLMDLRENRFFSGPTCPANIERLLGLRFGGDEVTRILLGESPRIEGEAQMFGCEGGRYRIEITAPDGRVQELELEVRASDVDAAPEEQRMRLRRSELKDEHGQTLWRVTYDDYAFVEDPLDTQTPRRGLVMPRTLRFEEPERGVDTLVRFDRLDLNVEVPEGAFSQRPRPGLQVEQVYCD